METSGVVTRGYLKRETLLEPARRPVLYDGHEIPRIPGFPPDPPLRPAFGAARRPARPRPGARRRGGERRHLQHLRSGHPRRGGGGGRLLPLPPGLAAAL